VDPSTTAVIRRAVSDHFRSYAPRYVLALGLMSIFAACTAASAWLMKDVVNRIFVDQDRQAMVWIPLVIAGIFTAKGFSAYFQELVLAKVGNRLVAETQNRLFRHIMAMDASFFQRHSSADIVTYMTQRATALREMLNLLAVGLGRDLLTLLSLVVVMVSQDPIMTAIALVGGPLAAIGLRWLTQRIKKAADSEYHSLTSVVATVREAAQGIRIVKAFQLERNMEGRMADGVAAVERINNRMTSIQALVNPLIETIGGLAVAGVVFYAGWRTLSQGQTPGEFFAFIAALLMAADPLRRLSRLQLQLAASAMGVKAIYQILDTPCDEGTSKKPTLRVVNGEIEFKSVTFSYASGKPILRDFSMHAEAGKTTALIGLSGSGKTTVFNLLQQLWRPQDGRILIDDQSLDEVCLHSLRSQLALVSQDVFLFEGTIRDNIAGGIEHRSQADIENAAHAAHIDAFIQSLPDGYDTAVGELGTLLSGGQRQRISIARAFLKDAPIILLDEPTSALDSETEGHIQSALRSLSRHRTTIVIAHRLSTILNADRIHVLSGGALVESGDHSALLRQNGLYAKLYRLQYSDAAIAKAEGER
jgi:ATP-binding cassette, subfamily B, bacterial MsbA